MRLLFSPGIALMHHLPNHQKVPLFALLFLVTPGLLYYEAQANISHGMLAAVAGVLLFGFYCMASYYLQAARAWAETIEAIGRIAKEDLTPRAGAAPARDYAAAMQALEEVR